VPPITVLAAGKQVVTVRETVLAREEVYLQARDSLAEESGQRMWHGPPTCTRLDVDRAENNLKLPG
jgi:hypothetical protein